MHGAYVTSWRPRGADEVLFVSSASRGNSSYAIRGGIPICFHWFGNKADDSPAPAHGFVWTMAWQLPETAVRTLRVLDALANAARTSRVVLM